MKYEITIQAIVTKTYTVEADDEDAAIEEAHQIFTVLSDDAPENYEQDVIEWSVVE